MSLVGKLVTVKVVGIGNEPHWEGRVTSEFDGLVEVVVHPPEGEAAFAEVCRHSPEIRLEYVENRTPYEVAGEIDRYATRFPCAVLLRVGGATRSIQRRRHPRIPTDLPVKIFPAGAAAHSQSDGGLTGTVVNLSLGGAAVVTQTSFKVGDRFKLSFIPGRVVSPTGRVVRAQQVESGFMLGIEFVTVSDQDLGGLQSFISSRTDVA